MCKFFNIPFLGFWGNSFKNFRKSKYCRLDDKLIYLFRILIKSIHIRQKQNTSIILCCECVLDKDKKSPLPISLGLESGSHQICVLSVADNTQPIRNIYIITSYRGQTIVLYRFAGPLYYKGRATQSDQRLSRRVPDHNIEPIKRIV